MGESLVQSLTLEGAEVNWWTTGGQALSQLALQPLDLVVCDIQLPDMSGEQIFSQLAGAAITPPFLFMTAFADIDQAVSLVLAGAGDYISKPFVLQDFIKRAGVLINQTQTRTGQHTILGISPQMQQVEATLRRLVQGNSNVLLTGETGVGKEVCARFLHQASANATKPFMAVNCAAIPSELMESELFGHSKGAFTGAVRQHAGYAERARDGVLFLDEISALELPLQGKLLRLLEDRTFHRIGGEELQSFNARLISASNTDLGALVSQGRFREDLFYRINVINVEIPPLRERLEDIPLLLNRFYSEQCELQNSTLIGMSSLVEEAALNHHWPGNVRELRNRIERAVALTTTDRLMPGDVFPELGLSPPSEDALAPLAVARDAAEKTQIHKALQQTGWRISEAAKLLDISRTTMWEKMRRYGISETPC